MSGEILMGAIDDSVTPDCVGVGYFTGVGMWTKISTLMNI
jgi:hypothetical protein